MHPTETDNRTRDPLTDPLGRRFEYLRLSVTDACNYRCNYCLPDGYHSSTANLPLTLKEIGTLVAAFAQMGTRKVRLTGGEPSLRRDLSEIIRIAKGTPGIREVAVTTNGYSLRRYLPTWIDAGLDAVNLSIDSLDPAVFETITGHDHLDQVLEGMHLAIKAGLRVKTNAVLLAGYNADQVDSFLDLAKEHPISTRFIELMQTGDNGVFFRENHLGGDVIRQHLEASGWALRERRPLDGPALEFRHPQYLGGVGLIMPYSRDFCSSCNRLRVSSTGKLHLCLFSSGNINLRELLQAGEVDSVCERVRSSLQIKAPGHRLQSGFTGSTRNLSGLGG